MTDVPELDMNAHIAARRAEIATKLMFCRTHLKRARAMYEHAPCEETKNYLVRSLAACEAFEAKQETLDVDL